jgi:ABC-2 type transport system permease protein
MGRARELLELTRMRVTLFLREPEAIFWVFVFPIVLAAVLGFAFRRTGLQPSRIGVVGSGEADALASALGAVEHVEVVRYPETERAERDLRRAVIDLLVEPGPASAGAPPRVALDPGRGEAETARLRLMRALERASGDPPEVALAVEPVTEKGSRYIDFLFPGLLGMNLMGTGLWGIGFAIADARRRKFLKRLLVTPMRRSSFLLSFILSRLVFLALEVFALVLVGRWILGVPFRAGLLDFALAVVVGAFTFAGIGILLASRARTIEGVSGLINLVMMPMWLGSGVFFSYERYPEVIRPILRALPLTALNDALRALMLDGDPILAVLPQVAILVAWCVVCFAVALRIFRWG